MNNLKNNYDLAEKLQKKLAGKILMYEKSLKDGKVAGMFEDKKFIISFESEVNLELTVVDNSNIVFDKLIDVISEIIEIRPFITYNLIIDKSYVPSAEWRVKDIEERIKKIVTNQAHPGFLCSDINIRK